MAANETCSVVGCDQPARARGWCEQHYRRWWRSQRPVEVKGRKVCTIAGCGNPAVGRGWCNTHLQRFYRTGSPHVTRPPGRLPVVHPGDVYGRLTVIEEVDPPLYYGSFNGRRYACTCSCGEIVEVWARALRKQNSPTRSCGCLRREVSRETARALSSR